MAKKASAKAGTGSRSGSTRKTESKSSGSKPRATGQSRQRRAGSGDVGGDAVDALLKLLQSPLVLDLLAVGATAAVAAITEERSARRTGSGSGKAMKAAGKAAAAAIGRRLATEFEEIRKASKSRTSEAA